MKLSLFEAYYDKNAKDAPVPFHEISMLLIKNLPSKLKELTLQNSVSAFDCFRFLEGCGDRLSELAYLQLAESEGRIEDFLHLLHAERLPHLRSLKINCLHPHSRVTLEHFQSLE